MVALLAHYSNKKRVSLLCFCPLAGQKSHRGFESLFKFFVLILDLASTIPAAMLNNLHKTRL